MPVTLPIEVYEVFEKGFGKEDAKKVLKHLEQAIGEDVVNKWHKTKDELREALLKEIPTKAELENVRLELLGKISELYDKTEKDKAELLGKISEVYSKTEQDKTELLGKMEKDKAELLGKISEIYGKTEQDKTELLGKTEKDKAELLGKISEVYSKTEQDKTELLGKLEKDKAELLGIIDKTKAELIGMTRFEIARLDRKFTTMFVILFFTIIFLNQNALEFLAKVFGLLK